MIEVTGNRVFLLDIEGTTTSLSFVKDILFPYAEDHLESHVINNWTSDELRLDIDLIKEQSVDDVKSGLLDKPLTGNVDDIEPRLFRRELVNYVRSLITADRKCMALKQLQGHIWRKGFESGTIKGHVFDDVPKSLEIWKNEYQCDIYIYSSGSIEAQKLHFGHTTHGNLLPLISGHFDTTTGHKQDSSSYMKIAKSINRQPEDILFLTDVPQEAVAAQNAGYTSIIVYRPGNVEVDSDTTLRFPAIESFDEIKFV